MEQSKINTLVELLLKSDCKELYVEGDSEHVKIVRSYDEAKKPVASKVKIDTAEKSVKKETNEIKSAIVGVFHFVNSYKIGDKIVVGEKIGYVESLNIKTDVISDFSGKICELPTKDGETVEYGQPVMILN